DKKKVAKLLGIADQNIKLIEEQLKVSMMPRGETNTIEGEEDNRQLTFTLIEQLLKVMRKGVNINQRDVSSALEMVKSGTIEYFAELYDEDIARDHKGKVIRAK